MHDKETIEIVRQWLAEAGNDPLCEARFRLCMMGAAQTVPLDAVMAMGKALLEVYQADLDRKAIAARN